MTTGSLHDQGQAKDLPRMAQAVLMNFSDYE